MYERELLARQRIHQIERQAERSGMRRAARLVQQEIRAARRHAG